MAVDAKVDHDHHDHHDHHHNQRRKGRKQPKICIVGAGMGGLTCALALAREGFTDIHVYEMAADLGFVGAGIQLAPNMARVLQDLGVWADIEREAVVLSDTSVRDGPSDRELARVRLDQVKDRYGFHHMVGHRASLANGIYQGCLKHDGIRFSFNTVVSNFRNLRSKPRFTVTPRKGGNSSSSSSSSRNSDGDGDGSGHGNGNGNAKEAAAYEVEADILLACDGIKSGCRTAMLAELDVTARVVDTGQAAYRIVLTREQMSTDPTLRALVDGDRVTRWIGPGRHIIAYPVANKRLYNLSTAQPDTHFAVTAATPSASYTTRGSKATMQAVFADFCPTVHKMLDLVPEGEVCEWRLRVHDPLPTWLCGATALVGDACHPTLPHLAQGAAQAIEDGAVIAVVLGAAFLHAHNKVDVANGTNGTSGTNGIDGDDVNDNDNDIFSPEKVGRALRVYEAVRKERAETLVRWAAASGRTLHLAEGSDKAERDRAFAAASSAASDASAAGDAKNDDDDGPRPPSSSVVVVPDKWADPEIQRTIYGTDCVRVARERFSELFSASL